MARAPLELDRRLGRVGRIQVDEARRVVQGEARGQGRGARGCAGG